jgi:hypothetical protein
MFPPREVSVGELITLLLGLVGYGDPANRVIHPPDAHLLNVRQVISTSLIFVMDTTMYEPFISLVVQGGRWVAGMINFDRCV